MRHDLNLLLRNDLLSFAKKAFWEMNAQRMPEDRYLELLASRLAEVVTGDSKRLIVNLPPRHFKSWIGSVCLSAWILGRDPSAKILIVTYGQELADKIAHAIRGILRSEWYKEVFKNTKLAKSRSKLVDFVTTAGGGVRSVSIEGGVTGHGADYILIDDPTELKDCDNVKRLDRVVELFDTEILTRLNNPKRGRVVIIAHRVNEDDLPGHLLEQGGWEHLQLPLIAMRRRSYKLPDGGVWVREKGELLRPDAFTQRDIELLQAARRPGFETVQQQNPGGTKLRIKPEHFGQFPSALVPMSDAGVVLSVDPGQKGGPTNSFSVIQAWLPVRGNHLLLEQWREQAHYPVLREAVRRMIKRHNASAVLIEDTNQGPPLLSEIRPRPGMRVCPIMPDRRQDRTCSRAPGPHPQRSDSTALGCGVARELSLPNGRSSPVRATMIRSMLRCNTSSGSQGTPPPPSGNGPRSPSCPIRADNKYNGRGVFRTRRAGAAW